jgi:hypothetical protein
MAVTCPTYVGTLLAKEFIARFDGPHAWLTYDKGMRARMTAAFKKLVEQEYIRLGPKF